MTKSKTTIQNSKRTPEQNSQPPTMLSWILALVPAAIIGRQLYFKIAATEDAITLFTALDMEPSGWILIALVELVCVILLLIPRLSIYGAILCLGTMIGAFIAHATVIGFDGKLLILFVLGVVAAIFSSLVIYLRRQQSPFISSMFDV